MKTTFFWSMALLLGGARVSFAQMGTMKYRFNNRQEVRSAVRNNVNDLRKSYDIIICARRQGMIRSAVQEYESLIGDRTFGVSTQLCSSYALAHHIMSAPIGWKVPFDRTYGLVKYGQNAALRVQWYRDNALKLAPQSPEVLLGYALWQQDQQGSKSALATIQRVVRARPQWADAHLWHAGILEEYRSNYIPKSQKAKLMPRYAMAGLHAIERAERLDPAFKDRGLRLRFNIYSDLGHYKKALFYYNAYEKNHPDIPAYLDKLLGAGSAKKEREYFEAKAITSKY